MLEQRRNIPAPELAKLPALSDLPKQNREHPVQKLIDPHRVYQDSEYAVDRLN
jgi:hypothetical protein